MVILGSTGSIGVNTLEICRRFNIEVEALVAGNNLKILQKQIDEFKPQFVAIADSARVDEIEHPHIFIGKDGILKILELSSSSTVVNALVGYTGLAPTIKSLELGKKLALANKESLVIAGAFLDKSHIVPIDSEHFGLWYLLNGKEVNRLIITASGGAFRDWNPKDIYNASYKDALKHPNWSMGDKITIDSASMANKLFELLEAKWLFNNSNISALIERKSIIHALVEFRDGSTTAHIADVDMKLPIAYALNPDIKEPILSPVNLLEIGSIEFEEIDTDKYPLWQIKDKLLANPKSGVVLNAANESAMEGFRAGRYTFGVMIDKILDAYYKFEDVNPKDIEETLLIDKRVRKYLKES